MLESGDFTNIMFQDAPRCKKPVGIYWLQAASVAAASSSEARAIWAYRIPSLLGAMLAAAACAWGAEALFGARPGLVAGALLGATMLWSIDADLADHRRGPVRPDHAGAWPRSARLYAAATRRRRAGVRTKTARSGLGWRLATLVKGPIGPVVALLTGVTLAVWDRRAAGRSPWAGTGASSSFAAIVRAVGGGDHGGHRRRLLGQARSAATWRRS